MGLYHRDVYMPRRVRESVPTGTHKLFYSEHARLAAKTDRYGEIELPSIVNLNFLQVIEVEHLPKGGFVKAVMRETGQEKNRVYVITRRNAGGLLVKTVWINEADDGHSTLRRNAYEQKFGKRG